MELPVDDADSPKPCCEADAPANRCASENAVADQARPPCVTSLVDFKLRRAHLLVYQELADRLAKLNLRPAEFSVLAMIARHPGQKQTTIAEELGIKRANFVFLMDSIERRGLAERRKDALDRRSHSLHLTEEGKRFIEQLLALWHEHEKRVVDCLGGTEARDRLIGLLDRLLSLPEGIAEPEGDDLH